MAGELQLSIKLNAEQAQEALRQLGAETTRLKDKNEDVARSFRLSESTGSKAWREIGTAAAAAGVSIAAVVAASERLGQAAAAADRHERAIASLGAAYDLVRQATNGVVTAEQAVRVQQTLTQAGIRVTAEQLAVITRRAREYANATGGDINQALDQMSDALRGLESEGLRRFGLSVDANASRSRNFRSVIDQMRDSFHGAAPEARTMGESVDVANRSFTDLFNNLAAGVARVVHLREVLTDLSNAIDGNFGSGEGETRAGSIADQWMREITGDFSGTSRGRRGFRPRRSGTASSNLTPEQQLASVMAQAAEAERQAREDEFEVDVRNRQKAADADAARRGGRGRAPNGFRSYNLGDSNPFESVGGTTGEANTQGALFSAGGVGGVGGAAAGAVAAALNATVEADHAATEAIRADTDAFIQSENARIDAAQRSAQAQVDAAQARTRAAFREMEARNSFTEQLDRRFAQHTELTETRAEGMAGLVEGAYNTMSAAMQQHIAAVITGKETIGEAMAETAKAVLLGLATQAITKAIFETAEGVAAAARFAGSYGADVGAGTAATAHFTSAGIYAVIGGAAAAGYVGLNAATAKSGNGVGAGSSPGAAASTRGEGGRGSDGGGGGTYIINVNGFAMHHEQVQDAVVGAINGYHDRNRTIRGLRYTNN